MREIIIKVHLSSPAALCPGIPAAPLIPHGNLAEWVWGWEVASWVILNRWGVLGVGKENPKPLAPPPAPSTACHILLRISD